MPPVPTATADSEKVHALIKKYMERNGCTLTDFARRLHRHPGSIWSITHPSRKPPVSVVFIRQLARELGVKPSDISDMDDDGEDGADALAS